MSPALLCLALASPIVDDASPASTNVRGADFPKVSPDGLVSFRVRAPGASEVLLRPGGDDNGLGPGPIPMDRDDDGVWSVTVGPAVPGFHYYWFEVDGLAVNDPGSETFFGWGRPTSGVEVPEPGVDDYDVKPVPHGQIRAFWYHSEVTGSPRRALVYTPPGYDDDPGRRFPVLYLQHGAGEDERGWTSQGRANFILDNLLAEGRAVPMIVVMDNGYADRPGEAGQDGRPGPSAFGDVLVDELIPAVDASFRTIADREHRALAGLSMGARQALRIGLDRLDTFASIGAFSPPPGDGLDVDDPDAFNARVRLFWIGAGTEEPRFLDAVRGLSERLDRLGVEHVAFESPGTSHEWQTWRRSLLDFAPRLFRD